jgi:ribosome maturation factor RimP
MGAQRPFFVREAMTATYVRERTLQDEIAPAVEQRVPGVEVLAVELLSPSRFCVYVDHPDGVDHALCAKVTRALDAYRAEYTIDVSSPGPERPLRKPAHFASAVGRRVSVRTEVAIDGKRRVRGVVSGADENTVSVEADDGTTLRIPYDVIVRGNLTDEGLTT